MKVWLDTDIGSDIDDALALAYLLARDDIELIGISTVTEVDNQRAMLASALCKIAGNDVPIYPGHALPLLVPGRQVTVPQAFALERWAHDDHFPSGAAVDAMRAAFRNAPGEITLLAIGPMTNVGVLFALDAEIPALLKELVLMCGDFGLAGGDNVVEWNSLNDPHAATLTYRARPRLHRSFGLDVTRKVTMPRDEFAAKFAMTELGRCALDMAGAWFRHSSTVTFHDPLAAASLVEPTICGYLAGHVDVDISDQQFLGQTHWSQADDGPHEVAATVDAERFFDHYFSTLAQCR